MKNIVITKTIIWGLVFAGVSLFLASYYAQERQQEVVSGIKLEIVKQEKILSNISEITDRNGADSVVESIIRDCNSGNRNRFEDLLNSLGTLNSKELLEIEDLFDACARFFSERKAVMVSRMDREFEVYEKLIDLLLIVDNAVSVSQYKIDEWRTLVNLEKKRSGIFDGQATVQYDIIKALQSGHKVDSAEIAVMLTEAKNINEEAEVTNHQIDKLRSKLLDI